MNEDCDVEEQTTALKVEVKRVQHGQNKTVELVQRLRAINQLKERLDKLTELKKRIQSEKLRLKGLAE